MIKIYFVIFVWIFQFLNIILKYESLENKNINNKNTIDSIIIILFEK